jgi:hypothetical protein
MKGQADYRLEKKLAALRELEARATELKAEREEFQTGSAAVAEAKETLRAEMKSEATDISEEMAARFAEMNLLLMRIDNKLDHVIETQADHLSRLEKLEGQKHDN